MTNLLEETRAVIEESGQTPDDIVFIGSGESGHSCNWKEFEQLADVEYFASSGPVKVATDLMIVFRDGQQMWRAELDGSEWWEYVRPFVPPTDRKPVVKLVNDGYPGTLAEMHEDDDD